MLNNLLQIHLNCFKKQYKKTAEATGDLIGNKISNKSIKVTRTSPQHSSETEPKERYIKAGSY